MADITELVQAPMDVLFYDIIMGKKSIDDYDEGVKEFAEIGYTRYLEIMNGAYDRYVAKREALLANK